MRKLIEQPFTSNPQGKVGKSHPHESAIRQVSGQARYVDDMPEPGNLQYAAAVSYTHLTLPTTPYV